MADREILTGVFDDFQAFVLALNELKDSRFSQYEAYGPTSLADIEDLMPRKGSQVRMWTTAGAIIGLVAFFLLCVMSSLIYALIVGGKLPLANVPFVVVTYEGTILLGGITAMAAGLAYAALRPKELPKDYNPSFSSDSYGISVEHHPRDRQRLRELLTNAGAVDVYEEN